MFYKSGCFRHLLIGLSMGCCFMMSVSAQDTAVKSDAAAELAAERQGIREKIAKIATGNDIRIVRRAAQSFHASITKIDTDSVTVNEVDLSANVELNYQQVKQVDKGYSRASPLTGKRLPPKTRKTIGWITLGGLAVLITVLVVG